MQLKYLKLVFLSTFISCHIFSVYAQDTTFARKTIDTLCSKYFSGRGYIDSGDTKAANYIRQQFIKAGLKPGAQGQSFFQNFYMDVNTFPGTTDVILKKKSDKINIAINVRETLIPGKDFLLAPNSGGGNFNDLKLFYADSATLVKIVNGKKVKFPKKQFAIVFDGDLLPKIKLSVYVENQLFYTKASALIALKKSRLVWSVAHDALPFPYIEVAKNAFDTKATSISINIDQNLREAYGTQNVIGQLKSKKNPDSFIVFSAHYDHLGKMGKDAMFPGANDNASGIAMLLDLARTYASAKDTLKYSLLFIAFAGEEAGLIGSKYYTDMPSVPLKNIRFLINMDLMGNGQDGMMAVNGSVFTRQYDTLVAINKRHNYVKEVKQRGKAANSDHYWFTQNGVPAFFFYLLGDYPYYHDIYDTAEKPTLQGYNGSFRLIRDFVKAL